MIRGGSGLKPVSLCPLPPFLVATVGMCRVPDEGNASHEDRAWCRTYVHHSRHSILKSQHTGMTEVIKHSYSEQKQLSFRCALEALEQI